MRTVGIIHDVLRSRPGIWKCTGYACANYMLPALELEHGECSVEILLISAFNAEMQWISWGTAALTQALTHTTWAFY